MGTGHNGGGPDPLLNADRVVAALEMSDGIKSVAAHNLGVHRTTLHRFIKDNPEVQKLISEIDEGMKDLVEGKMLSAIRKDDGQMIRFYLERKARDRGYGQRQEVTGANGGPIQHEQPTVDTSKLTFDEKKQMLALHRKALPDDAEPS